MEESGEVESPGEGERSENLRDPSGYESESECASQPELDQNRKEEAEGWKPESSLLLSDVRRECTKRTNSDGSTYNLVTDTLYISAAGQDTELHVEDHSRYINSKDFNPEDPPEYDVQVFVTLAAKALDHLYDISGFRAESWDIFWDEDYYSLSFSVSGDADNEGFYWVNYGHGSLEANAPVSVSTNSIGSMGIVWSEREDWSPISRNDLKKPDGLEEMSREDAARWYYENYLIYDGPEIAEIQKTDLGTMEVCAVDGSTFYLDIDKNGNLLRDIYGPYPGHSGNQWYNPPEPSV